MTSKNPKLSRSSQHSCYFRAGLTFVFLSKQETQIPNATLLDLKLGVWVQLPLRLQEAVLPGGQAGGSESPPPCPKPGQLPSTTEVQMLRCPHRDKSGGIARGHTHDSRDGAQAAGPALYRDPAEGGCTCDPGHLISTKLGHTSFQWTRHSLAHHSRFEVQGRCSALPFPPT